MPRKKNRAAGAPPTRAARPGPTGARAVVFPVLLTLAPLLIFVLLEAGLRLGGYGVATDLVLELDDGGVRTAYLNPDVGRRYFARAMRSIQPLPGFRTFSARKEPGTLRVFVLGESSVAGFPFHVNGSFAGFLEDDLHAAYPGRAIEVINCGMSSIGSFTILDFTRQLVRYDPDLFLVYMGHNEFYGALGAGATGTGAASRGMVLLRMKLARLRTYQLASDAIFRARRALSGKSPTEGKTLMASMVGEKRIRLEDAIHGRAERNFRANLEAMLEVAARHRVPVILSTVVSNLRDLPPFDSAHADGFSEAERTGVDLAIRAGALPDLQAAVARDTTYAEARFALARALDRGGDARAALREYTAARDHDVVHFRACSRFNRIIRDVAAEHRTPLVDMEAVFAAQSPQGIPGRDLFLEHLHPNLRGAVLMADAFRAAMEKERFLPGAPGAARSLEQVIHDAAVTPLDIELARQRIEVLTRQWPFEHAYAGLASPFEPAPAAVQRMAERVLHKTMGLDQAHEALGREYVRSNDPERALEEFRALAKIYPVSPVGHQAAADILLRLGRPAEAIPYYRATLALLPGEPEPRWRLAAALHATGDDAAAIAECERVLSIAPGHAGATRLLGEIRTHPAGGSGAMSSRPDTGAAGRTGRN